MKIMLQMVSLFAVVLGSAAARGQDAPGEAGASTGLTAVWVFNAQHANQVGHLDWTKSDAVTIVDEIDWETTSGSFVADGPSDYFGVRLVGTVEVPETGLWSFELESDESAVLWIDGEVVIDDSVRHSRRTRSNSVWLEEGPHALEVWYFERRYSAALSLRWMGPGVSDFETVPNEVLRPAAVPIASGGGLRAFWSDGVSHADRVGQIDWSRHDRTEVISSPWWRLTSGSFEAGGASDYFGLRLAGTITIPEDGGWTFELGSDESAQLLINGRVVVDDSVRHSFRWRTGSVKLPAGEHDFEVRFFERRYSAGLTVAWRGPSDSFSRVIPASAFTPGKVDESGAKGGLRAYWSYGLTHADNLGQVDWDSYDEATIEPRVNWRSTSGGFRKGAASDYFAVRLLGKLEVPASGDWAFHLGSDEAAGVWINGEPIVVDDVRHSFRWRTGKVRLEAGSHEIEVRHFERRYSAGLVLSWEGPGTYEQVIPTEALTPIDASDSETPGGLRAYWQTGTSHANRLGDIDFRVYDETTLVPRVNWRTTSGGFYKGGPKDYFGVRLAGEVYVDEAGEWSFNLGSDEAVRLWVDGRLLVNDGTRHSFRWRKGVVKLEKGWHPIEVHYMERRYSAGLVLTYQGPSDPVQEVVPSAALRPEEVVPSGYDGGGLTALWSTGLTHASHADHIDWDLYDRTSEVPNVYRRKTSGAFEAELPSDYFAVRYRGTITVPATGTYAFGLGTDEAGRLLINGRTVVEDGRRHSFRFRTGKIELTEGEHEIDVRVFERRYTAGAVLTWQPPGQAYPEVVPAEVLSPLTELPAVDLNAGGRVIAKLYDLGHRPRRLSDIDWSDPTETTRVSRVYWKRTSGAFWEGGPRDGFALELSGTLSIPEGGTWNFEVGADDGFELVVDGEVVVEYERPQSFRVRRGSVSLERGEVPFRLRFFEAGGWAGLTLGWKGPGGDYYEVVPPDAFLPLPDRSVERVLSWGEIGRDEAEMARRGVPLGERGVAARRAGNMTLARYIQLLRDQGADEEMIRRLSQRRED